MFEEKDYVSDVLNDICKKFNENLKNDGTLPSSEVTLEMNKRFGNGYNVVFQEYLDNLEHPDRDPIHPLLDWPIVY